MVHYPDLYVLSDRLRGVEANVAAIARHLGVLVEPPIGTDPEPAEPGPADAVVQVSGDNPALAAAPVQADALTGGDQVADVGIARHDALRDIPSFAGGPATTPALTRATEAYRRHRAEFVGDGATPPSCTGCGFVTPLAADGGWDHSLFYAHRIAATLSAALHDPDDAIVAALREEFAYRMRTSAAHGRAGRVVEREDIDNAARCALAKARAAILGTRGEEVGRGDA